jgi:hypothetical protein
MNREAGALEKGIDLEAFASELKKGSKDSHILLRNNSFFYTDMRTQIKWRLAKVEVIC